MTYTREQMEAYYKLKNTLRQSENYVPRPYQTIGGMWTTDTYKKDGVTLQIMDEGYSARLFTELDKLDVLETNVGHMTTLEFKAGDMDTIKDLLAVMGI